MTVINEHTMYCAICGGPIKDPDVDNLPCYATSTWHLKSDWPWLAFASSCCTRKASFQTAQSASFLPGTKEARTSSSWKTQKPLLHAIILAQLYHRRSHYTYHANTKCVSVAKRAMAAQEASSHRSLDESMRHLWRVLKDLFDIASEENFGPTCNIYSAQAYGDSWRFQELVWQPGRWS